MPTGECIKANFVVITGNPLVDTPTLEGIIPTSSVAQCCAINTFFASSSDDAELKNDKSSVLFVLSPIVSTAVMYLQKADTSGTFQDVATLDDNVLGTFYALSFNTDDDSRKYIGYLLNFHEIISAHDAGNYRVKVSFVTMLGNKSDYSQEFCLKEYSAGAINGTIRIETYTNGIRGVAGSQTDYIDFKSLNWYNQIRLKGMFGFDTSEYTRENVEYNNGQKQWIVDEQTEKYVMKLKPVDEYTRLFLKTDVLQADDIILTDYNSLNPHTHISTYVTAAGSFEPRFNIKEAIPVDINFESAFNNLRKKRC